MSNGWTPVEQVLRAGISVPQSQTDAAISNEFKVTAHGSCRMVIAVSGVAAGGSVDIKLQSSAVGSNWVDIKSTTLSGTGVAYIKLLVEDSADQSVLPLLSKCRLVVTTGVGESLVVNSLVVLQPL